MSIQTIESDIRLKIMFIINAVKYLLILLPSPKAEGLEKTLPLQIKDLAHSLPSNCLECLPWTVLRRIPNFTVYRVRA